MVNLAEHQKNVTSFSVFIKFAKKPKLTFDDDVNCPLSTVTNFCGPADADRKGGIGGYYHHVNVQSMLSEEIAQIGGYRHHISMFIIYYWRNMRISAYRRVFPSYFKPIGSTPLHSN